MSGTLVEVAEEGGEALLDKYGPKAVSDAVDSAHEWVDRNTRTLLKRLPGGGLVATAAKDAKDAYDHIKGVHEELDHIKDEAESWTSNKKQKTTHEMSGTPVTAHVRQANDVNMEGVTEANGAIARDSKNKLQGNDNTHALKLIRSPHRYWCASALCPFPPIWHTTFKTKGRRQLAFDIDEFDWANGTQTDGNYLLRAHVCADASQSAASANVRSWDIGSYDQTTQTRAIHFPFAMSPNGDFGHAIEDCIDGNGIGNASTHRYAPKAAYFSHFKNLGYKNYCVTASRIIVTVHSNIDEDQIPDSASKELLNRVLYLKMVSHEDSHLNQATAAADTAETDQIKKWNQLQAVDTIDGTGRINIHEWRENYAGKKGCLWDRKEMEPCLRWKVMPYGRNKTTKLFGHWSLEGHEGITINKVIDSVYNVASANSGYVEHGLASSSNANVDQGRTAHDLEEVASSYSGSTSTTRQEPPRMHYARNGDTSSYRQYNNGFFLWAGPQGPGTIEGSGVAGPNIGKEIMSKQALHIEVEQEFDVCFFGRNFRAAETEAVADEVDQL